MLSQANQAVYEKEFCLLESWTIREKLHMNNRTLSHVDKVIKLIIFLTHFCTKCIKCENIIVFTPLYLVFFYKFMGHISVESNHFLFDISRYFESKWVDLVAYKMEKLKKFNCVICTDCAYMWKKVSRTNEADFFPAWCTKCCAPFATRCAYWRKINCFTWLGFLNAYLKDT